MTQMKKKPTSAPTGKFKPKKRRTSRTTLIFWICLVLIVAPLALLGWNLFSSSMNTHSPVLGNRYKGDLNPAITKDQMKQVETKAAAVNGVTSADVEMTTATLRVYADIADDATADTATATADSIYKAVSEVLDPSVYFTKTDSEKMYDMEIHVYTTPERTGASGENFVYVIETKTSSMDAPEAQVVSTAKDPTLAQQLRDDVAARAAEDAANKSAADGGTVVGGNEAEATASPAE
jgi:hypothetical protein